MKTIPPHERIAEETARSLSRLLSDRKREDGDAATTRSPRIASGPIPLLVAVSGGPDSVCLLHAIIAQSPKFVIDTHVAHLHHGQRKDADDDVAFTRRLAESLGATFHEERADVPGIARRERISLEMAGRRSRYRFLGRVASSIGAEWVATGHHADDQAETVAWRVLRGAGTAGLRGIPSHAPLPESDGAIRVIRPLLGIRREEIAAYLDYFGLESRHDSTNDDPAFPRNRIRHELLPLAEEISPGARKGLLRLAREADEIEILLEKWTAKAWESCATCWEHEVRISAPRAPEEAALLRRVLRRAVTTLLPAMGAGFPEEAVERLMEMTREDAAGTSPGDPPLTRRPAALQLPDGIRARRHGETVTLIIERVKPASRPYRVPVTIPGRTRFAIPVGEGAGDKILILTVDVSERSAPDRFPPRTSREALLDAAATYPPVVVRNWEPGDRIRVLGSVGTRLLSDLFTEARVPVERRRRWPLVCDSGQNGGRNGGRILWAPELALHDAVKVTDKTRRVLRMRLLDGSGESGAGETRTETNMDAMAMTDDPTRRNPAE